MKPGETKKEKNEGTEENQTKENLHSIHWERRDIALKE